MDLSRDWRRLRSAYGSGGSREVRRRVTSLIARRLDLDGLDFPLAPADIVSATSVPPTAPSPTRTASGSLHIGWVMAPPAAGSGGHTTIFRMVEHLERAGHTCHLVLHSRQGVDLAAATAVIRSAWPQVRADVHDVDDLAQPLDAVVATGWPSAHVLAARQLTGRRFYFIQDFEPYFHPHGFEYELAADTYRFGFVNIALGAMVRDALARECGIESLMVPFSCDNATYRILDRGQRSGVVLYAKPGVARRGYTLAVMALEIFGKEHPEVPIHVYGATPKDLPFPHVAHGRLSSSELNELYNQCRAGLAMSFTNISLVAEEMLGSGCIPIVNDSANARADLDSDVVSWAEPTPRGIADALAAAALPSAPDRSAEAAASVRRDGWQDTSALVREIIETECGATSMGRTVSSARA